MGPTLFDELGKLGFGGPYPTLTRMLRQLGLRPACEPCSPGKGRPVAVIDHPPGEETQWDWLELPDPPAAWGWGKTAHLLVGAPAHSGRWRDRLCEAETLPHLVDGLDTVCRALGGLTRLWRFDRMATVANRRPAGSRLASPASRSTTGARGALPAAAREPPRRGSRRPTTSPRSAGGAALADDVTVAQAQALLDDWCARRGDLRARPGRADGAGPKTTVVTLAAAERLAAVPAAYPAELAAEGTVSAELVELSV